MEELYEQIEAKLVNYPRFVKEPNFNTVKEGLTRIGYKDDLKLIHVAGTNGKGSVIAMLDSIMQEKGLKVGRFTSPHLVDIRERMVINGQMMAKETFIQLYKELTIVVETMVKDGFCQPTFFEWIFLLAMSYFHQVKPDVILLETGLGGRLDTTNVLNNKVMTIITSIGLDHVGVLGDDVKGIAREKAGIIRKSVPTVFLNEKAEVEEVIESICEEKGVPLIKVLPYNGNILKRKEENIDFLLGKQYYKYEDLRLNKGFDYQLTNALVALTAVEVLQPMFELSIDDVLQGFKKFRWPGRLEYLTENIIIDGAHNPDGIKRFVNFINNAEDSKSMELLFGCMPDKDMTLMIESLLTLKNLENIYIPLTDFITDDRATRIKGEFEKKGYKSVIIVENLNDFIEDRISSIGAKLLLGCVGSLYLIGEVIKIKRRMQHD